MDNQEKSKFIELLRVTLEYYEKTVTDSALMIYWNGLNKFSYEQVEKAIGQHIETNKFMPKVSCVIELIPDDSGYLSADEAWELLPWDERLGGYVTPQAMAATPFNLIEAGDMIAARMAFKAAYESGVKKAKAAGVNPSYFYSAPAIGSHEHKQNTKEAALCIAKDKKWIDEATFKSCMQKLEKPVTPNNEALALLTQAEVGFKKISKK